MASLSWRVAMRRQSFSRQKARLIRFRSMQAAALKGIGSLRDLVDGMTALVLVAKTVAQAVGIIALVNEKAGGSGGFVHKRRGL